MGSIRYQWRCLQVGVLLYNVQPIQLIIPSLKLQIVYALDAFSVRVH